MSTQRSVLFLCVCLFFPTDSFAKKRKLGNYWRPSGIVTKRTLGSLTNSASENLALQRIIKSENQRIEKDPYLKQAAFNPSTPIAKAAIIALGRMGDPNSVETLSRVLTGKNDELKSAAAFSLGQIGTEMAVRLLSQHVAMERKPEIRGKIFRAMGFSRLEAALPPLQKALNTETNPAALKNIAEGIGMLFNSDSTGWDVSDTTLKRLIEMSVVPAYKIADTSAAFAISQYKGSPEKLPLPELLSAVSKSADPIIQALLIRALSRSGDPQVTTLLASRLSPSNPTQVIIEATKGLKGRKLSELNLSVFEKNLTAKQNQIVAASLETIHEQPDPFEQTASQILDLFKTNSSPWIKSLALRTLTRVSPEQGRKVALENLRNKNKLVVSSALAALISLNRAEDWVQIQPFLKQGYPEFISESLEMLTESKLDLSEEFKSHLKDLIDKKDPGLLALIAQLATQRKWTEFAQPLADAFKTLTTEDTVETRTLIISSLGTIGSEDQISTINLGLKDRSKQVVMAAIDATKAISGKEPTLKAPLNSGVTDIIPSFEIWRSASHKTVILKTSRGNIEFRLFEDTPITAHRVVELVKNHFYDEKSFHRMVPNFVTQGGDPRGDGFGGPGFLIRDEFTPRNHERGTIGIATSGKDTGGSQFFFNLFPNYHLNGRYTVFAEVTSGMDVVDKLEVGDKITSAVIK